MFGQKKIYVDLSSVKDEKELHTALKSALDNDGYTGENLDALHDVLTGICKKTILTVTGFDAFARELDTYAEKLALVLAVSASENRALTVVFDKKGRRK